MKEESLILDPKWEAEKKKLEERKVWNLDLYIVSKCLCGRQLLVTPLGPHNRHIDFPTWRPVVFMHESPECPYWMKLSSIDERFHQELFNELVRKMSTVQLAGYRNALSKALKKGKNGR